MQRFSSDIYNADNTKDHGDYDNTWTKNSIDEHE